jgi:hypothetical protein
MKMKSGGPHTLLASAVAACTLAGLASTWFYVANVADISEPTRAVIKDVLFWSGVGFLVAFSVFVSLRSGTNWVRITSFSVAAVLVVSSSLYSAARRLLGGNPAANSATLGEPRWLEVLISGIAAILGVGLSVGLALTIGWVARRSARALRGRELSRQCS